MFNFIEKVMKNGYTDEHNPKLYGSAIIAHSINHPVDSITRQETEKGRKFVQNYFK